MCPLCRTKPEERFFKSGNRAKWVCFHFISRKRKATRWDKANVIGACNYCNVMERFFPDLSRAWFIRNRGVETYLDLVDKASQKVLVTEIGLKEIIRKLEQDLIVENKNG